MAISEKQYRFIVEHAREGVWITDRDGKTTYVNPRMAELLGTTVAEMADATIFTFMDETSAAAAREGLKHRTADIPGPFDFKFIRKDGGTLYTRLEISPLFDDAGEYQGALGLVDDIGWRREIDNMSRRPANIVCSTDDAITGHDISERKRSEMAFQCESEERYNSLFKRSLDGVYIHDLQGNFLDANDAALGIVGYAREDLLAMNIADLLSGDQMARARASFSELKKTGSLKDKIEYTLVRPDGCEVIVEVSTSAVYSRGRMVALQGIIRDITGRVRVEKALRESEEIYRTVADFTHDWEYWIGPDGNYRYVSPSCERITGYRPDEFITDTSLVLRIIHPEERPDMSLHLMNFICKDSDGARSEMDFRILTKDGRERWIGHVCSPVYGSDGSFLGRRGSNRDITERKWAEEEVRRLNRHIAGVNEEERRRISKDLHDGVGHAILAVKMNLDLYMKDMTGNRGHLDIAMDFIEKSTRGLREACMDLYPSLLEDLGLEPAIRWYVKYFLEPLGISARVDLEFSGKQDLEIEANLYRIIQEALSNVVKHSGAGFVSIALSGDDKYAQLVIEDDGRGMEMEIVNKKTSGNGLSNIRQRADNFGGTCAVVSSPGQGTKITVKIKRSAA